jgi:MOSC domain-containing protein YiiM
MFEGMLVSIHVAPSATAAMQAVPRVRAVAGRGLEGDRYFLAQGTFSMPRQPDDQVTLIEEEAVAAVFAETKVALREEDTRRNLVTRGVPLNHLVGREFVVGSVRFRGHGLCEPCKHLESLTRGGLRETLLHRGGLRAEILSDGVLEPGQTVRPA